MILKSKIPAQRYPDKVHGLQETSNRLNDKLLSGALLKYLIKTVQNMYLPIMNIKDARTKRMIEDHSGSMNEFGVSEDVVTFPAPFSEELIAVIELAVVLKKLIFLLPLL